MSKQNHKFILFVILVVTLTLLIINFFIPKNLAILSGEFLFSFDYNSHFNNLLLNYILNPNEFDYLAQCRDCPSFYQISAWYMGWEFGVLSIGQLLALHPIIFYSLLTITTQITFLYLALILHFKKFNKFAFIFAASFFIFAPHKFYLVPSSTLDGVIHGILIGIFSIWIYIMRRIEALSTKRIIVISLALGLLSSLSFNVTLAHFPLLVYGLFFATVIFINKILKNFKKFILAGFISIMISVGMNIPFIWSQIRSGNIHTITSFNAHSITDSLFAGFVTAGVPDLINYLAFSLIIWLLIISKIRWQYKVFIGILYLFIAWILMGARIGNIYVYQYIFDYFPLMNHIRSLYRLIFFELVVLFVVIYLGLAALFESHNFGYKVSGFIIGFVLIAICFNYIQTNMDFFQFVHIPHEYLLARDYLQSKVGKKMYFPLYGSVKSDSMSGNYTWSQDKGRNSTLYGNPFNSLFFVPELQSVEGYQLSSIKEAEIRSLLDYEKSADEIIKQLKLLGIKYLIIDENYNWKDNYPQFALNQIKTEFVKEKKIGNLEIYRIDDLDICPQAFGDFHIGYCNNTEHFKVFINRTAKDYALHLIAQTKEYSISPKKNVKLDPIIVNPPVRMEVIKKNINITEPVYEFEKDSESLFEDRIKSGNYNLFVPVLKLKEKDFLFRNITLDIKLGNTKINQISPYADKEGFIWEEIAIQVNEDNILKIGSAGNGFMVIGKPLLIPSADLFILNDLINQYQKIPTLNFRE